jgi:hypothetical protein
MANSVSACSFNADATLLAYAIGYDWSQGFSQAERRKFNQINVQVWLLFPSRQPLA